MQQNTSFTHIPFKNITRGHLLAIVGIMILFVALRWNSFRVPFERDEGEYAYSAWLMRQHIMPYDHAFLQKPPMIIYTYMAGQYISEDSLAIPRIFSTISLGLSILLIGVIVSRDHGTWTGISAMSLMAPMLALPIIVPFAANTEVFMVLPLMGVLASYTWKKHLATGTHWFIAGVFAALAILYKPIALFIILAIFFVWCIETWRAIHKAGILIKYFSLAASGGLLTALLVLSPFLVYDLGRSMWECAGQYNMYYAQLENSGQAPFVFFLETFWKDWWIVFALLLWFIIARPFRWWMYTVLLIVSIVSVYKTSLGHYYIMVIPFLAIISSLSITALFDRMRSIFNSTSTVKKMMVLAIVVMLLILPYRDQPLLSPNELTVRLYSQFNPFVEAQIVADHVERLSSPLDNVFIAGSEPEVLYYAKRKSPSRFVIMYPLMLNTPVALQYQQETMRALKTNVPEVIVFVRSKFSWLQEQGSPKIIANYINELLTTEYSLAGGVSFDTKDWHDIMDADLYQKASMLVYKRKPTKKQ